MIPKTIHYCWFGGNPLPKSAIKCINSWKKFFPEYEIKEWNESNFDVNMMPFTLEAYAAKKYAFVSDVARFVILERHGGIYFDTDVEVVKPFDEIIGNGAFMGIEIPAKEGESVPMVNPGLGLGCEAHIPFFKAMVKHYQNCHFIDPETGIQIPGTVVSHTTNELIHHGLLATNKIQEVAGITIYPQDFFNPLEDATGILNTTPNTHSIHWYSKTWCDKPMIYFKLTRILHRIIGTRWSR